MPNFLSAELLPTAVEVRTQHQTRRLRVTAVGPLAVGDTIQGYSIPAGASVYAIRATKYAGAPAAATIQVGQITSPPNAPIVTNPTFYSAGAALSAVDGVPVDFPVPVIRETDVPYSAAGVGVTLADRPTVLTLAGAALGAGQSIAIDVLFSALA
jgi:hypothetical protein